MRWIFTRRAASLALTATALMSMASSPAESGGECLGGHAYVDVAGDKYGITSTLCVLPTDCASAAGAGPSDKIVGPATVYYYVNAPLPESVDAGCYL